VQKNRIYLARHTRVRKRKERKRERASPKARQSVPSFRSASRTPAWRARAAHRTERERRTRAQDEERSAREHPTSTLVATHRGIRIRGRSASTVSLTSPHLTSPHFSACCCFAFYTGVEIWSLDSPMHYPAFSSRTRSIVLLQKRIYIIKIFPLSISSVFYLIFHSMSKFYRDYITIILFYLQVLNQHIY